MFRRTLFLFPQKSILTAAIAKRQIITASKMEYSINTTKAIKDAFVSHEIAKDVFPKTGSAFVPHGTLLVDYPTKDTTVAMGNTLPVPTTQDTPKVYYHPDPEYPVDTSAKYTLVCTDPDATSRANPIMGEYCHWVAKDIQFDSAEGGFVKVVHNVMPYMGPGPPKGTGLHRYIFLLYKQDPAVSVSDVADRVKWGLGTPGTPVRVGVEHWATENKLTLLAANFFFAEQK